MGQELICTRDLAWSILMSQMLEHNLRLWCKKLTTKMRNTSTGTAAAMIPHFMTGNASLLQLLMARGMSTASCNPDLAVLFIVMKTTLLESSNLTQDRTVWFLGKNDGLTPVRHS